MRRWSVFVANNYRLIVYSATVLNAESDLHAFDELYVEGSEFQQAVDTYRHVSVKPWRAGQ